MLTVHNRRDTTLACLAALQAQRDGSAWRLAVIMVDDGSTDGTREAVAERFPDVRIVPGSGSLFWAGGMALAEQHALALDPDLLLWLNDDVVLDPDALVRLLAVHRQRPDAIVVGTVRDPETGAVTYGPRRRLDRHPQRFAALPASHEVDVVDAFNGNVVLLPRGAHNRVGTIDGTFAHAYADDDYSLRAAAAGVAMVTCPGTQGTCAVGPTAAPAADTLRDAWDALQHPTRRPWSSQVRYLRRHAGWRWPVYLGAGYVKELAATLRRGGDHGPA